MARLSDLATIHERLIEAFGAPRWEPELDPLSELIVAVLSQHTAYPNSRRAFAALRERFPTWDAVRGADVPALEDAIRPAGLAKLKAPRLRAILDQVAEEHGALELDFLAGWPVGEAQRWLERLPGVGPATARRIIEYRERQGGFRSWTELSAIPGISSRRRRWLRGLVVT
jgi:endonuclease-3